MTDDTDDKPVDQYDFWRRRLAGEVVAIHDGEPQPGFYRVVDRTTKNSSPVAIWFSTSEGSKGELRCRIGVKPNTKDISSDTCMERWPWFSKNPISRDVYTAVVNGGPWPDQSEAVTRDRANDTGQGDDESFEALSERIKDLAREADRLCKKGAATTKDDADQAADLSDRLAGLRKKADAARKVEKTPHDEAAAAVQQKWLPVIQMADIYTALKKFVITPFLVAEENKRKAAEAEQRKKAEDAVKAGKPVDPPAAQYERTAAKAGGPGRRGVHLRTTKKVTISDRAALLAFFADGELMTNFLQDAAEKAVKAGVTPPGVSVTDEQTAT